ncbi:MAG: hypothetical protein Q9226_005935 [Calogaya cf. arnoldii]
MSSSSTSPQEFMIAWAARVSLPQLGARLTAYVKTKASITTFRLAAQRAPSAALRNLPEEIIFIIASCVRDTVYETKIEKWIRVGRCLAHECDPLSHFSHEEMTMRYPCCTNWMTGDDIDYQEFSGLWMDRHDGRVEKSYQALTAVHGGSNIAKFIQIFTQDFGICPYFMLDKQYAPDGWSYPAFEFDAKAYLSLRLTQIPVASTSGPEVATFAVNSSLEPSMLTGLTKQQYQSFMTAAAILKLHAYDADEDASMFLDLPGSCGCTRWEDCQDPWTGVQPDDDKIDHTKCGCARHVTINGKIQRETNSVGHVIYHGGEDYHPRYRDKPQKKLEHNEIQPRLMILGCGELASRDDNY